MCGRKSQDVGRVRDKNDTSNSLRPRDVHHSLPGSQLHEQRTRDQTMGVGMKGCDKGYRTKKATLRFCKTRVSDSKVTSKDDKASIDV